MINITFPDGSVRAFEKGVTGYEIAKSISPRLAEEVLAVAVKPATDTTVGKGVTYDLNRPIEEDSSIVLLKWDDDEGKRVFWHSSSHLMAEALEDIFPGVKFGIGPAIENGFYYDVDLGGRQITDADFAKVEKRMLELAREKQDFVRQDVSKADALKHFEETGDKYKCELISELADGTITYYTNGHFTDLCRGPHLRNTEVIKAVKLTAIAGAYWRGDEKREQLTRIYGITFPKKSMLDEYLVLLEEAKKRDHRKIGKEMELFTFSSRVGLGLPLWLPRGSVMRFELEKFLRKKQNEYGYLPVVTPHIGSKDLYVTSGHYAKYGKDSFQPIHTPQEGEEYMLKPMNCPHHCEIFRSSPRSYKDLPLRLAEFGTVYRYEQSGELHGLTRVRSFTQDDAHMFVTPDQLKGEFEKVIDLILYVFRIFKFDKYTAQVSLRDPNNKAKYIGSDENWEKAENAIIEAAKEKGLKTVVEYGEAAFYGPKLDFMVKDAIGRKWQLGTIQVDYNLPERFQLEYTDADGSKKRPIMIHRAPFGSIERFTAVLLEHTSGHLPLWLSPDQIKVLPVSEKYAEYAKKVCGLLNNSDIRTSLDDRNETLGKRIREISLLRVPVLVIVGEKEVADGTVSVRREGADAGTMKLDDFVKWFKAEVAKELE
ncbi:MAG: threonine--tRNA ligase [Alistipes sp.]|jgi:threonyl-tRNA synthetase|uniref:threonine--tRNA ligase n=1 Tax=Candidatus Cryptobacteroides bacterium TaxID=3085639 RepID=UPI00033E0055|nr:threonine--tRNA ligase [Alistipes sp.]MCI6440399.1 threonine--tRNA ligase [Alistipes sp.]MEE1405903.1 threonine--tRNA ligase [Bacteroidales bacterium]CDD15236.1 threonine--tRNA ligase [Alistipes sp. CAG:435]